MAGGGAAGYLSEKLAKAFRHRQSPTESFLVSVVTGKEGRTLEGGSCGGGAPHETLFPVAGQSTHGHTRRLEWSDVKREANGRVASLHMQKIPPRYAFHAAIFGYPDEWRFSTDSPSFYK